MIGRAALPIFRAAASQSITRAVVPRSFYSTRSMSTATASAALPLQRPVGALRGGLFGFLAGSVAAGAAVYYYVLDEYRLSNEMLTEDIYALHAASQRLNGYITELERRLDEIQKKEGKK